MHHRTAGAGRAGRGARVSLSNGTGLASQPTCGRRLSYGSASTSSPSAMGQTQSGLTLGMHHAWRGHGWRSFFLVPGVQFHLRPWRRVGGPPDGRPAMAGASADARGAACDTRAPLTRRPVGPPTLAVHPVAAAPGARSSGPLRPTVVEYDGPWRGPRATWPRLLRPWRLRRLGAA